MYKIGKLEFSIKNDIIEHFRNVEQSKILGEKFNIKNTELWDLLKYHPNQTKLEDVKEAYYAIDKFNRNLCLYLVYDDNTIDDISWRKCITPIPKVINDKVIKSKCDLLLDKMSEITETISNPNYYLYLAEIRFGGEGFCKIGVTSDLNRRFKNEPNLYHTYLKIIPMNQLNARGWESYLKEQALDYSEKYYPKSKFSGHTECYQLRYRKTIKKVMEIIECKTDDWY